MTDREQQEPEGVVRWSQDLVQRPVAEARDGAAGQVERGGKQVEVLSHDAGVPVQRPVHLDQLIGRALGR